MVADAERCVPPELAGRVTFQIGDTHTDLFPAGSFDAVISRQVVCHLHDPLRAFRHWHTWIEPGGIAVVIDGFWSRQEWATGALSSTVDQLPLSCVQTIGTAAYLLTETDLAVTHRGWMDEVNRHVAVNQPGATQRSPRYLVIAQEPSIP